MKISLINGFLNLIIGIFLSFIILITTWNLILSLSILTIFTSCSLLWLISDLLVKMRNELFNIRYTIESIRNRMIRENINTTLNNNYLLMSEKWSEKKSKKRTTKPRRIRRK